jgi:tetratricopeptide (TPR) repeat protein
MKTAILFSLAIFAAPLFAATPAEIAIRQAMANVEKQPDHYPYYNELAAAYARRAHETADVRFYTKAEEALQKSFSLAADNYEGLSVATSLQLSRHEFAQALGTATRLNKLMPDDVIVYGYIVDADVELGNYKDAIVAAQWMLNLREGNVPGLTRAAYLRELHGRIAGALELIQMAYDRLPASESEERAWVLAQEAHLELLSGDLPKAESDADAALRAFPDYDLGIDTLAQVRLAQARYAEAVTLFRQRHDATADPHVLYELAEAQELAGQHDEAKQSFQDFEKRALTQSNRAENANRELIYYYVDHAQQPAKALEIAKQEMAKRQDVFTLDAYAWALAGTGDYTGANAQLEKPLAMDVKDPKLLFHAGSIALHLHRSEQAQKYLKDAASRFSHEAGDLLRTFAGQSKVGEN